MWMIINHEVVDLNGALPRILAPAVADRLRRMPVVVVTGARQTGKTTLVQDLGARTGRRYVTLDSMTALDRAHAEPDALLAGEDAITIDEAQRVPDLLLAIKREVDRRRRNGRFLLAGSANLLLLKGVSESLAGRATHLALRPLTEREKRGAAGSLPWPVLLAAKSPGDIPGSLGQARRFSWRDAALRGGLPHAALAEEAEDRAVWFDGYVDTYLRRDLRDLAQVGDLAAFARFVRLLALRTGGLLNVAEIARDAALPPTTARRWLSILDATFLVTLLPPFAESQAKRIIKSPKVYSLDTGLGLHLAGLVDPDALSASARSGAWLENLVLNDILAWRETETRKPSIGFRRTASGEEVDFVIEQGQRLLPIEVKASTAVRVADAKVLDSFCTEFGRRSPFALLLYTGAETLQLTRTTVAVPLGALL